MVDSAFPSFVGQECRTQTLDCDRHRQQATNAVFRDEDQAKQFLAFTKTSVNMGPVSLPVDVFCWLG